MENFLTMKEAVEKYIAGCETKCKTPVVKLMVKAMLAGMMIALGAAGSSVAAHDIGNVGLARLISGVIFPVGLMMVIVTGAELFTGDCLMILGTAAGRQKPIQLIRTLALVYLGNFIGSILLALAIYGSGQLNYSGGLLGAYTIKVALGKATLNFGTAMVSGILCNILVCAAVMMALCARDISGKLWVSFFLILLFVVGGYEHCVANMYYIPAGLLAVQNPHYAEVAMATYGYTAEQLAELNIKNFLLGNLLPVTIGNIIGGMVVFGIPIWYVNKDK